MRAFACHYCGTATSMPPWLDPEFEDFVYPSCCAAEACTDKWHAVHVSQLSAEVLAQALLLDGAERRAPTNGERS
jgi:hypothetical protein